MGCASSSPVNDADYESGDLEVVRKAVARAYQCNAVSAATNAAEGRIRKERQLPDDWNMRTYCGGKFLEGGTGGRQASSVIAYQPEGAEFQRQVQTLFDNTYRKCYTRDRRGAPIPDRFVVKEVHRVMNDQVWREYAGRRAEIKSKLGGQPASVPGDPLLTSRTIGNQSLSRLPALDSSINENFVFHGTTQAASTGIAENDFRLDFSGSNAGTLYGKGIYLAENCSKADEYGEGPKGPAGSNEEQEAGYEAPRPPPGPPPELVRESYILICRATLGRVNYTLERKPDPDKLQKSCLEGGQFESVIGDRLKTNGTFREIIVFNDDHVYPEYIVKYERIFFHERFAEIYGQMLARQNKGKFNGATPDEMQVLQSMWNVFAMPNKGRINKWQLLDLLLAIYQPPLNEDQDLDDTFKQWDTKKDGVIDWDEFYAEICQRVKDGISNSAADYFAGLYEQMLDRKRQNKFQGATDQEQRLLKMVWYQYSKNQRTIDKWQLLELLKAIDQPPENDRDDLDETFKEMDTKKDGVLDVEEFLTEINQRVHDGMGM